MRKPTPDLSDNEPVPAAVRAALLGWAAPLPSRITVAVSGGLDSTVLLAALVRLQLPVQLRAAYVDHGLQPAAQRWGERCEEVAAALGVTFVAARVTVDATSDAGLEAAARDARYRALGALLANGEWLLTAHHSDDQLETVLLRLLRGSGVRGLRGIVPFGSFGGGFLGRPLLDVTRAAIEAQARAWGLAWSEDPTNRDEKHDRNFLRHRVVPELRRRWPAVPRHAVRMAEQMAEAEDILTEVARADAAGVTAPWCVPRAVLEALTPGRQRNLLRHIVREAGFGTPSAAKLDELLTAVFAAEPKSHPVVRWQGAEGRVFRGHLYLLRPMSAPSPPGTAVPLGVKRDWSGPEGEVRLTPGAAIGLPVGWAEEGLVLRFRAGGERLCPRGDRHHRTLKYLFQEQGVLPWMRERVPLVFRGNTLVAVGDAWLTADVDSVPASEPRLQVSWTNHPPVVAP